MTSRPGAEQSRVVGPTRTRSEAQHHRAAEAKSLDFVQRVIISSVIVLVAGTIPPSLGVYLAIYGDQHLHGRSDVIGLWVMSGVIGLFTMVAILVLNRRKPQSPLVLIGLVPMIITAFWIFG